jgi:protein-tyrosine phosphatase
MAERLLARALERRGVHAEVSSAGLMADGWPASPEVVELLGGWGLDATAHRSRALAPEVVAGADLVLGMAREHVREVALVAPGLFPRAFTLRELVRRGRAIGPRAAGEPLHAWLVRAGADRRPADLMGSSPDDDIVDPIGAGKGVYRQVAAEIDELTGVLADLAWPPERSSG